MFGVDFDKIIRANVPADLQQSKLLAFVAWLVAPVKYAYGLFFAKQEDLLLRSKFNGQTIYLEYYLNEKFNTILQPIYIVNNDINWQYLYKAAELKDPVYIYEQFEGEPPLYLYTDAEMVQEYDFTVFVPAALGLDLQRVKGEVDYFRIAGTRFNIIEYL